jgi:hypothetical protein
MASKEGFRRITSVGRWTAIAGAFLLLAGFLIQLWESRYPTHSTYSPAGILLEPGFYLTITGWLVLGVGWIGAGFSLTRDSDDHSA